MHAGRVGKVHKKPSVIAKTAGVTIRSVSGKSANYQNIIYNFGAEIQGTRSRSELILSLTPSSADGSNLYRIRDKARYW